MLAARSLAFLSLAAVITASFSLPHRSRRQLDEENSIQPLEGVEGAEGEEQTRDKRKLEGITQAKFGIKNAVLGFVFGSGTTWRHREVEERAKRLPRQTPTTADGIPIFDRNRVSLDFPGRLFGPSVSLVIKSTKVVGSLVQNTAERYRTFLALFRPLFRGPFEIKGLDPPPPTTKKPTTTSTTTTTAAPTTVSTSSEATEAAAENEVRRRRRSHLL